MVVGGGEGVRGWRTRREKNASAGKTVFQEGEPTSGHNERKETYKTGRNV